MSIKMMKMVWDFKLPETIPSKQHATAKLVLLKLADNSDDNGKSFPSMDRIAHECSIARRTVVRVTETLESSQLIHIQRRTNEGLKINSIYWLNIPMLIKGSSPYNTSSYENENPWLTDSKPESTDVTICPSVVTICPPEVSYDHINHQEPSINRQVCNDNFNYEELKNIWNEIVEEGICEATKCRLIPSDLKTGLNKVYKAYIDYCKSEGREVKSKTEWFGIYATQHLRRCSTFVGKNESYSWKPSIKDLAKVKTFEAIINA